MRRAIGRFWRKRPLFGLAVAAAAAVFAWPAGWPWVAGAALAAAGVAAWSAGGRPALAWLASAGIAVTCLAWRESGRANAGRELAALGASPAAGCLLADAEPATFGWEGRVELREPSPGAVVVWRGRGPVPAAGAEVSARGKFGPIEGPRNPGEYDERQWADGRGIAAEFWSDGAGERVETGAWAAFAARIRRAFREAVTAGLEPDGRAAKVIRAVVIGDYPKNDDALVGAFRNSGTLHVFSVSGLHVAMVGMLGWTVLRWLRISRRWAVPLLIALMFGYAWLTGNSPPAVRSAWMAAVFLGAFWCRRRPDLLNALGAVLLAAAWWDGRLLWQPGVQLSYGVVAAIGLGAGAFSSVFGRFARHDPYLPRVLLTPGQEAWLAAKRRLANDTSASCAAWLGSTPLVWWHFGLVTPIAAVASLVLVPLVFVLVSLALAAVMVWPFAPAASAGLNRVNGGVACATAWVAGRFAEAPGGNVRVARGPRPQLLVYDLDHGAGAVCFAGADGAVLLDVGDRSGFRRRVFSSLRSFGLEPDAVVLSHPDGGHVGAGREVLEAFPIRQVLLPVERARSKGYQEWLQAEGVRQIHARAGERLPLPDGAALEILAVPDPSAPHAVADDRVAIYRLHWRGRRILFVNDAGWKTERRLLDAGLDLRADVLVAGRHRTDGSLGDEFLATVSPRAIIAGDAGFPPEERLDPAKASRWRQLGIAVFDQLRTGGVTILPDADQLRIEGFLNGQTVKLSAARDLE